MAEARQDGVDERRMAGGEGSVVGVVREYADLLEIIRLRKEAAHFTNLELDDRAGLPVGYTGKLFSRKGAYRRTLGRLSLGLVLGALKLRIVVVADGDLPVPSTPKNHMQDRSRKRRPLGVQIGASI